MDITGRKLFVKAPMEEGVDTIFAYPGGMVTDIVDELYRQDAIEVVLPRHEQALVHEAEGYARATGKPGICLVTKRAGGDQHHHGHRGRPLRQHSADRLYRPGAPGSHRQ